MKNSISEMRPQLISEWSKKNYPIMPDEVPYGSNIMMFLHNNPQYDTAADIVKTRMLTKSHVSAALKALEDKRYIERSHRNGNRKSVHLKITGAAESVVIAGENAQKNFAGKLFKGFSDAEFAQCRALFSRMCENARNGIQLEV